MNVEQFLTLKTEKMEFKNFSEIPLFMSCSSFEYPESEFILYTGTPRMLFAVVEDEPETELFRFIEHQNGDQDYIMVADCFEPQFFEGKTDEQSAEHIGEILDQLEGWYISEVLDLESYEEE